MTPKKLSLFTFLVLLLALSCKEIQPTDTAAAIHQELDIEQEKKLFWKP